MYADSALLGYINLHYLIDLYPLPFPIPLPEELMHGHDHAAGMYCGASNWSALVMVAKAQVQLLLG